MLKLIKKRAKKKIGTPPGTLIHIGDESTEKITIEIIDYDETQFEEKEAKTVDECFPFRATPTVTWINVNGVHNPEIVRQIGTNFNIHSLILEDILNTGQRPKYDDFEDYIYIVLKMLYYDKEEQEIMVEQVSLLLGSNYVISFQEKKGDVFDSIRDRIRTAKGRIRKMHSDYLAYSLMDAIIDNYFVIFEKMGEKVESMEDELVSNPTPRTLQMIHELKRDTLYLRKSIWPLREVINSLERGESALIRKPARIYFRDLYDHAIQLIDTVETLRDMISSMLDIYLSSISNRMNEVMKTLTIFAAIFIPLTFLAGIYGMNFEYMPELGFRWAYPVLLSVMAVAGISLVVYFKKRNFF